MPRNHFRAILLIVLVAASPLRLHAQVPESLSTPKVNQWSDSVVRVFCENSDGSAEWGTAFLVNNAGYLVTNNHVASQDVNESVKHWICFVIETVPMSDGTDRYILHETVPVWFSPSNDLAVLRCTGMHARPIPMDYVRPQSGDDVYSLGFPVCSDNLGGVQGTGGMQELNECTIALVGVVQRGKQSSDWDVTNRVNHAGWQNLLVPTLTKGIVSRTGLVIGAWAGNDALARVPVIQHTLPITGGNSGGPLISARGGVIGVVGDNIQGLTQRGDDTTMTYYATAIGPLVQWLNPHNFFCLASPGMSTPSQPIPTINLNKVYHLTPAQLATLKSYKQVGNFKPFGGSYVWPKIVWPPPLSQTAQ